MRALYTAASGLYAQQTKLDLIANNIANVNTTGYKTTDGTFAELLRSQFTQPDENQLTGRLSEPGLQIGNGVRGAYLAQSFAQGNLQQTNNPLDLAIEGDGFFTVQVPVPGQAGRFETVFTRSGKFQVDTNGMIVTDGGYRLLGDNNEPIQIPEELRGRSISVAGNGDVTVQGDGGPATVGTINLVLVRNPEANLKAMGDNLYRNGNPDPNYDPMQDSLIYLVTAEDLARVGAVRQGMLEMSNVDLPQEMTDLIQIQRAYQLNARSVQTVDAMMGMANNLRA